jgi:hypothetical protein
MWKINLNQDLPSITQTRKVVVVVVNRSMLEESKKK